MLIFQHTTTTKSSSSFRVSITSDAILSYSQYYNFGMEMPGRSFSSNSYRYGMNGQEKDDEIAQGIYTAEFWEYDSRLGKRWNTDPVVKPWESSYACFNNNPINMVDPNGDDAKPNDEVKAIAQNAVKPKAGTELNDPKYGLSSTHTDRYGNVVAVYNDGDKGVYKHKGTTAETNTELKAKYSAEHSGSDKYSYDKNTSGGGEYMGETEFWDEFIDPSTNKAAGHIMYGQSWQTVLLNLHKDAMKYDLKAIGDRSKLRQPYDIKNRFDLAPFGPMSGKMLDGKFATARSAGNYLAGWNGRTGTYMTAHLNKFQYMNLAGSLQQGQFQGMSTFKDIIKNGKTFGPAPYYGEIPYSGRMIILGWDRNPK